MYIKQISIQGFKSYKDQTVLEPFSPKHNVIVGRNGSGKSNFFQAIRFVLSDMFSNMRGEDRQSLLHEGAGASLLNAYVEIIFDNSDGRFPIEKEEVVLRRSIGAKKDEYHLDRKHVTKSDVINLLESAGFSRSNPYYIVQQGKITSLATMKDSDRLDLLKEVAGTRVYDEKREDSVKIMNENGTHEHEGRRKKIDEVIEYIEERLSELEAEKEELAEYQKADRERRALEYALYDQQLRSAKEEIEQIDNSRHQETAKSTNLHEKANRYRDAWKAAEKELKSLTTELQRVAREKEQVEQEKTESIRTRTNLELDVKDLEDKVKTGSEEKESIQAELVVTEKKIKAASDELESAKSVYLAEVNKERQAILSIAAAERRLTELYSKQGQLSQFKNKDERDRWLQKQINELEATLKSKREQVKGLQQDLASGKTSLQELSEDIADKKGELEQRAALIEKSKKMTEEIKQTRDAFNNDRKSFWKRRDELQLEFKDLEDTLTKADRSLTSTMPKSVASGASAVKRIVKELGISGVHGQLIDLFDVEDKFATCVEVVAASSLFFIVVDNDDITARLLEELNRQKAGRVTFMPLNKLKTKESDLPSNEDVIPMISRLKFRPQYRKAFLQVFGKTLVSRNLEVASKYSREHDLNCITMEGDRVDSKGAITGGYTDKSRSRLDARRTIRSTQEKLKGVQDEIDKVVAAISDLDQRVTTKMGELQKEETRLVHLTSTYASLRMELHNSIELEKATKESIEQKEQMLGQSTTAIKTLEEQIETRKSELGTDLLAELNTEDRQLLSALNADIRQLKETLVQLSKTRAEAESKKGQLETLLSQNLEKRREEAHARLQLLSVDERRETLEHKRQELKATQTTLKKLAEKQKELEINVETKTTKQRELRTTLDEQKTKEGQVQQEIQDEAKRMEKLLSSKSVHLQKQEENEKKIRELGSLPTEAFERIKNNSVKVLMKKLAEANANLTKFSHVNKKAFDQYMNFTEQRDNLNKRKQELDSGAEAIQNLITTLDQRKDEAIQRTFKGVAKHFTEVFAELVPGGKANLVMQKQRKDKALQEEEEGAGEAQAEAAQRSSSKVLQYSGVAIKVAFPGQGEAHLIQQLSGGQKCVVALALIFAIQRSDPAPFYLFDEIDANLDAAHRTAVAGMIKRLSESAQFITTTFRPEFVEAADKHYLVTFRNRVSHVHVVDMDDALAVIREEQAHT